MYFGKLDDVESNRRWKRKEGLIDSDPSDLNMNGGSNERFNGTNARVM